MLCISLGFVLRAVAGGGGHRRASSATGCSSARCCSRSSWPWPSGGTSWSPSTHDRGRAPQDPGRVQPLPARPDDLGGDGVLPHRLRLLHPGPGDAWQKYRTDRLAWTIPFVLYGIFRYLYLVHQKEQGGSPTDILITDRPLLVDVLRCGRWPSCSIVYTAGGAPMPLAVSGRDLRDRGRTAWTWRR